MPKTLIDSRLSVARPVSSKLGRGMARMVQACKAKNIPKPYYEVRPGGVDIVFRFKDINDGRDSNQNCELDCESIGGLVYVGRSAECVITSSTILLERIDYI